MQFRLMTEMTNYSVESSVSHWNASRQILGGPFSQSIYRCYTSTVVHLEGVLPRFVPYSVTYSYPSIIDAFIIHRSNVDQ